MQSWILISTAVIYTTIIIEAEFREFFNNHNINAPSTSTQHLPPIGFPNVAEGRIHVGHDIWIDSEAFDMITANTSAGVVVRDLCRSLFSEDELLNSTVTGRPSNKNKKQNELNNVNPRVQRLSGTRINAIRDTLEHYLNVRHKKMPQIKKDQLIARVRSIIASLIADLKKKKKENQNKSNDNNNKKNNTKTEVDEGRKEKNNSDENNENTNRKVNTEKKTNPNIDHEVDEEVKTKGYPKVHEKDTEGDPEMGMDYFDDNEENEEKGEDNKSDSTNNQSDNENTEGEVNKDMEAKNFE